MAKKQISELKEYFEAGKRPTENQFKDVLDSYVHIDVTDFSYGEAQTNTLNRDNAGAAGVGVRSGFYQTSNPVNFPQGAASWWHLLDIRHSNVGNNYAMQIAGGFFDQDLWYRKTSNDATQAWRKIIAAEPNGNVGIGTNSPSNKLEVSGRTVINKDLGTNNYMDVALHRSQLQIGKFSDYKSMEFAVLDNGTGIIQAKEAYVGYHNLSINPIAGNVGIGTADPQSQFHVQFQNSEPKSVQFVQFENYPETMNSAIRYTWYNSFCDVGIVRNGGTDISSYVIKFNGTETAKFAANGNAAFQGKIEAKDFIVSVSPTADFVFEKDYRPMNIFDLENFIAKNKHLPEIPSAKKMTEDGLHIGDFQIKLLQKIEDLTLYIIAQNKEIENLKNFTQING